MTNGRLKGYSVHWQNVWASLMSYELAVERLEEILPIQANVDTVFRNIHTVAERTDSELGLMSNMSVEGCLSLFSTAMKILFEFNTTKIDYKIRKIQRLNEFSLKHC